MLALLRFGDSWMTEDRGPPLSLVHSRCGHHCSPLTVCSHCRQEIHSGDVTYRDGPGAGQTHSPVGRQLRRVPDLGQFERGRPSSVSRALQIIGDRWSFLIIREAFFGAKRFDTIQERLGIASNILADRLSRFVDQGVLSRIKYHDFPDRFEYRLTTMGRALYLPLIQMLRWGDRWLSDGRPPLILTHTVCGHDFLPRLVCHHCETAIDPHEVKYKLNYVPSPEARISTAALLST
jgi:DNA-binding HxlR family transcriptional regulator